MTVFFVTLYMIIFIYFHK